MADLGTHLATLAATPGLSPKTLNLIACVQAGAANRDLAGQNLQRDSDAAKAANQKALDTQGSFAYWQSTETQLLHNLAESVDADGGFPVSNPTPLPTAWPPKPDGGVDMPPIPTA